MGRALPRVADAVSLLRGPDDVERLEVECAAALPVRLPLLLRHFRRRLRRVFKPAFAFVFL